MSPRHTVTEKKKNVQAGRKATDAGSKVKEGQARRALAGVKNPKKPVKRK